jgi:EAL domain-containing protein (putative c-di-GMP-specific phosphodiesterase class I)
MPGWENVAVGTACIVFDGRNFKAQRTLNLNLTNWPLIIELFVRNNPKGANFQMSIAFSRCSDRRMSDNRFFIGAPANGYKIANIDVAEKTASMIGNSSEGEHLLAGTELTSDIISAIRRREFVIDYQPRIDTTNGQIASMEALVRWQHPELGLIEPDRFIPMAESNDTIIELGEWVLNASLTKMREWNDADLKPGKLAVNVSARQLRDPAFVDVVLRALSVSGVAVSQLELELTESVLITDMPATIITMNELATIGVQFAIDDFGTGFASLNYLHQLPVKAVKIDQTFIRNIATGLRDAAFVRAVITMIADLGLKVVAEGVENRDQLDTLRNTACDEIQGFVFSRPLSAGDATELLNTCPAYAV